MLSIPYLRRWRWRPEDFAEYFAEKVDEITNSTCSIDAPAGCWYYTCILALKQPSCVTDRISMRAFHFSFS